VRQRDASIRHHDHQVPQTQFEARVPADTKDDDLPVEMSSLEQCFDRNERLHSVIIPDRGLLAPEPAGLGHLLREERKFFQTDKETGPIKRNCGVESSGGGVVIKTSGIASPELTPRSSELR
jgi:hypothetical protein